MRAVHYYAVLLSMFTLYLMFIYVFTSGDDISRTTPKSFDSFLLRPDAPPIAFDISSVTTLVIFIGYPHSGM